MPHEYPACEVELVTALWFSEKDELFLCGFNCLCTILPVIKMTMKLFGKLGGENTVKFLRG